MPKTSEVKVGSVAEVDRTAKYRMRVQGTQYSEPGWGLAWPIDGPAEVKALPDQFSTFLAARIRDGLIVEAAEADETAYDEHAATTRAAYLAAREVEKKTRLSIRGDLDLGGQDRMNVPSRPE